MELLAGANEADIVVTALKVVVAAAIVEIDKTRVTNKVNNGQRRPNSITYIVNIYKHILSNTNKQTCMLK